IPDAKLVALLDRLVLEAQLGPPTCRDRCPGCRREFPRAGEEIGVEAGGKDEDNLGAQRLRGVDVPVRAPLAIDYVRGLRRPGHRGARRPIHRTESHVRSRGQGPPSSGFLARSARGTSPRCAGSRSRRSSHSAPVRRRHNRPWAHRSKVLLRFWIDLSIASPNCLLAFSLSMSLPRYEYGSSYSRVHRTQELSPSRSISNRFAPLFRKPLVWRKPNSSFARRSVVSVSDSTFIPPTSYTQCVFGPVLDAVFTNGLHRGQFSGVETASKTRSGGALTSNSL